MERDEAQIDPAVLDVFVEALLARQPRTNHAIMQALSDGFRCDEAGLGRAGRNRAIGGGRFSLLMICR
jgi:hypothetical protein